jgi:6-phosphogluconolactonase
MTEAAHKLNVSEDVLTWSAHGKTVTVHCFANTARAGSFIADTITEALRHAIDVRGKAVWIGCGGTTPKPIYQHLIHAELDWTKIILAQVDERFVPVDDVASNTRMMREALAPVLADKDHSGMQFLTLIQDIADQAACAVKAEKTLRDLDHGHAPHFDFALMGMGPDSHYASIFPHNPINAEVYTTDRLVLPVKPHTDGSEPSLPRITLSVPAINNSRRILFYITGQAKLDALKASSEDTDPYTSPIGAFIAQCPTDVEFVWAG